jgi:queuosine precursor transporter
VSFLSTANGKLLDVRWSYVIAHAVIVAAANWAVQYPFPPAPDALTWGAFVFPFAFFITDLCNRRHGVEMTRKVVLASFVIAVAVSFFTAEVRIAIASGAAFLTGQMIDAQIFNRLRRHVWWVSPAVSNVVASTVDSIIFFSLAFAATGLPWVYWAVSDYAIKIAMVWVIMPVYGFLVFRETAAPQPTV